MILRLISLALAVTAALAALAADTPRYIFYCIGDGMGFGQVMAADAYLHARTGADTTLTMMRMPVASVITTRSASSDVTDSAAAGTALATGHKTRNSMLGMTADTIAVPSIATVLHNRGYGVGLVTTAAPDDATPGAFYAHVPNRGMYYEIGCQAAASGYEFIAGSQWRGAIDKATGAPTDLYARFADAGIAAVSGLAALDSVVAAEAPRRIFLTSPHPFNDSNVGFTIDSIPDTLTLAQMTDAAIAHLERVSPDSFFVMIEAGNIDHAGHANDGGTVAVETLAFDSVIARVLRFAGEHPGETLVIVTADHETGGLSVGNRHTHYAAYPALVAHRKVSKTAFDEHVKELLGTRTKPSLDDMMLYIADNLGLGTPDNPLDDAERARLADMYRRIFVDREEIADQKTLYGYYNPFSAEVFDILEAHTGFGWTTLDHSGNPVPVYAAGAAAPRLAAARDNTDIPRLILGHDPAVPDRLLPPPVD